MCSLKGRGWVLRTLRRVAFTGLLNVLATGCVNQTIDATNAGQIFDQFSSGNLQLDQGLRSVGNNIWFSNRMFADLVNHDWAGLSKLVIEADSGNDIGYFYLGLSAEGLGFPNAAAQYYQRSISDSETNIDPTECTYGSGRTYAFALCHGIVLPDAAEERLRVISGS